MTLDDALAWLDRHVNLEATAGGVHGLSLDRMRMLAGVLGDPQRDFPAIHITGTNGKGSTAHLLTRLFGARGLYVGTYTSPHVSSINERIQLAGRAIDDAVLAELLADVRRVTEASGIVPSWFEIMTGAALRCFADAAVDVAVTVTPLRGPPAGAATLPRIMAFSKALKPIPEMCESFSAGTSMPWTGVMVSPAFVAVTVTFVPAALASTSTE